MKKFKRVLVANRGEIAIRIFRACHELGIRTVAVYSNEDKNALYRLKADESYLIGENKNPVEAYLDIDGVLNLAQNKGVDAIHPGYGFLAENPVFAKKCEDAGITFIGPSSSVLEKMGDKIRSKEVAQKAAVPIIPGSFHPIKDEKEAMRWAKEIGFPIILKAAAGGGGRGMRIVRDEKKLPGELKTAQNEALRSFGTPDVFMEKCVENPKHIEVQILGDQSGNLVHLFERDCSIQRRHQKIIEFAPAFSLPENKRQEICREAVNIARAVSYQNAGTCEFLVDKNGQHYFIEMNPRIQVEHTVTEMLTGVDLVQAQILIAEGHSLASSKINLQKQADIEKRGFSIQCRITTEDPANDFAPDTGRLDVYRSGGGFGVRLDGGNAFTGATISPYYDSLLVKSTSWGRSFEEAIQRQIRSIREIKVEGVKTNIAFLINVLNHGTFRQGNCSTHFIQENPELLDIRPKRNIELKTLNFIADKVVNETKGAKEDFDVPVIPDHSSPPPLGTKQILEEEGIDGLVAWIRKQEKLLLTDTTMRDAHQSLMATRVRNRDLVQIAPATASLASNLFSVEMWGGATFDVAYRFLKESPWERLEMIRQRIPNILLQMLIRGANGVGYQNYPDNVIKRLIQTSAQKGIDVFRIFDSLNWIEGMEVAIEEVLKTGKVAEVAICYTGDLLDHKREKYTLDYYIQLAKEIEKRGAHILAIKDMSALLKPYAAHKLVDALKNEVSLPIHIHTHDTTGNGVSAMLMAAEAGADIVDTAFNSMAGITSQPALNSIVAALENTDRDTGLDLRSIQKISDYWNAVRPVYSPFESDLKSATTDIYRYEIPGGQYSNLKPQVDSLGLGDRFTEVKEMFRTVNQMFGDIVKVTPSSKAVGDMAIFMVRNDLTPDNIFEKGQGTAFPDSVVSYFKGMMGQPAGGFPKELQKLVLGSETPIQSRPGELIPDENFDAIDKKLTQKYQREFLEEELISSALYPKMYEEYLDWVREHGDFSRMGSDVFFHGLKEGEISEIEVGEGKTMVVKLVEIGKVDKQGYRSLVFEVNGNRREIKTKDLSIKSSEAEKELLMANPQNPDQIGASLPGRVIKIPVAENEVVEKGQTVMVVEAMKMETAITAPQDGCITRIFASLNQEVKSGELLITISKEKNE